MEALFFPSLKKRKVRGKEAHKEKRSNREVPLRDEQMAVLEVMPKEYQLLFLFLACHGKRVSEAISLKWDRYRLQNKELQDL